MNINLGTDVMALMDLRVPIDMPVNETGNFVQTYAVAYEVPNYTPPDHVHCIMVDAIAELEMIYGMSVEHAFEYAILLRVHTIAAGFDPEEDWERFYNQTEAGRMETAMRALNMTEKFRIAAMESSLAVPLVEGREIDVLNAVRGCVGCGKDRPGIPSGAAGKLAHAALNDYFSARERAAQLPSEYLTAHKINKRSDGWSLLKTMCAETSNAREHSQGRAFDRLVGTPVKNTIRERAEKAGFEIAEL